MSKARVDSGPISTDEERVAIELVDAQLISTESGMSRVGVEDVDAEQSRIDMQQAKKSKRDATMASRRWKRPDVGLTRKATESRCQCHRRTVREDAGCLTLTLARKQWKQ